MTEQYARESLTLYTKLNDSWGMGVALKIQGWVFTYRGDYQRANQIFLGCLHSPWGKGRNQPQGKRQSVFGNHRSIAR